MLSIKYYGQQIKKDEMDGTCSIRGKDEKVWKPAVGRTERRWVDNIEVQLTGIGQRVGLKSFGLE